MALYTQQMVEDTLRPLGFTGRATGGAADAFIANNPAAQAAMQNLYTSVTNTPNYSDGVMPLNVVPMNPWEQTALQRMASGVNPATVQRDPYADAFLKQAQGYTGDAASMIKTGAAPISESDISKFFNPYQRDVIDASMTGLSRQAEELRAQLVKNAGQRGAASFGSTITANPMAALNRDLLETGSRLRSGLQYQGYSDAVANALKERGLMQVGGQQLTSLAGTAGNLASTGQGIGSTAITNELNNIQNQLGAGQTLRNYQQGVSDIAFNEYLAQQMAPLTQAQTSLGLIPQVTSGQQTQTYYQPSRSSSLLGKIAAGADILGAFL